MEIEKFDFVVIGSGLAGLTFALNAAEHGTVCILTKAELFESNTSYAQGGIAAAIGESDSWELHEQDTLTAGAGLCDREAVRFLVQQAPSAIEWLAGLGVRFDRENEHDSLTDWALGREAGHSRNRIVHHQDRTGWEVERAINEAARSNSKITIFENAFAANLLTSQDRCCGVRIVSEDLGERFILGRAVMLASGGCGQVYEHTTNPRIATGDGIYLAAKIGAKVSDMEFMQFHPTTLYHPQMRSFLITEAARGEGGTLRNHLGDRFMYDYDERLELAPRDITARAIDEEMRRLQTWCVYLDLTHLPREQIQRHFPTISEKLAKVGILPYRHWIPIVPAQHYSCGGINTNLSGQSNIPGLYSAGETARTGVHGANRLASNSLLEALVFAKSAAAAAKDEPGIKGSYEKPDPRRTISEADAVRIRRTLRKLMMEQAGIVRRNEGLGQAQVRIQELMREYASCAPAPFSTYSVETEHLLLTAEFIVNGAIARKENIGLHYNADQKSAELLGSPANGNGLI